MHTGSNTVAVITVQFKEMYITLCIKCRCRTAFEVEDQRKAKPAPTTSASIKLAVVVCIACKDICQKDSIDYASKYEDLIVESDIVTMQEWGYITKYTQPLKSHVEVIKLGDHVRVFENHDGFMYKQIVTASVPITTCRNHRFDVHNQ